MGEIVEVASSQSDCKKMGEMVEAASSLSRVINIDEIVGDAFTQPDGKESTKMVKTASTRSDIQSKIQKKRKELAEELDGWKANTRDQVSENKVDLARYRSLVRAFFDNDVKGVEDFINKNLGTLLDARIDEMGCSIFHLIVQVPGTDELTGELVSRATPESLEQTDVRGFTALHSAAVVGNTKAVKLFLDKNPKLLSLEDHKDFLPVQWASDTGHYKETVEYLLSAHAAEGKRSDEEFPDYSARVLPALIGVSHIDLAFRFLNQYPELADQNRNRYWNDTMDQLVRKDTGRPHIPVKTEEHNSKSEHEDIENQTQASKKTKFFANLQYKLWNAL